MTALQDSVESCTPGSEAQQLIHRPNMIGQLSDHCGPGSQRTVNATKTVNTPTNKGLLRPGKGWDKDTLVYFAMLPYR